MARRKSNFHSLLSKLEVFLFGPLSSVVLGTAGNIAAKAVVDLLTGINREQAAFETQVAQAVDSLRTTSTLVTTLQQNVEERMAQLQHLREEHERYSALAHIEATQAEALLRQVETMLGREQQRERWIALAMHLGVGFLFFVLGVAFSDAFKGWLTHVWKAVR